MKRGKPRTSARARERATFLSSPAPSIRGTIGGTLCSFQFQIAANTSRPFANISSNK